MEENDGKNPQRPTYPPCDTCGKKNHSTERCWQGAGAHLQKDANASTSEGKPKTTSDLAATSSSQSNTKKTDSKN